MFLHNVEKCLKVFDECYVSSDSPKILELAEEAGAGTIRRPKRLCGETPNITCYKHAQQVMNTDILVAVQANSPTIKQGLLEMTREIMFMGTKELMTCHPINRTEEFNNQSFRIYGSIWAVSRGRLKNYPDPYKPNPEVLLIDESIDIHYEHELRKAKEQYGN